MTSPPNVYAGRPGQILRAQVGEHRRPMNCFGPGWLLRRHLPPALIDQIGAEVALAFGTTRGPPRRSAAKDRIKRRRVAVVGLPTTVGGHRRHHDRWPRRHGLPPTVGGPPPSQSPWWASPPQPPAVPPSSRLAWKPALPGSGGGNPVAAGGNPVAVPGGAIPQGDPARLSLSQWGGSVIPAPLPRFGWLEHARP